MRRGLRLEYATLGWNVLEIGFLAFAAVMARSVALAGFALDSCIEIFASLGDREDCAAACCYGCLVIALGGASEPRDVAIAPDVAITRKKVTITEEESECRGGPRWRRAALFARKLASDRTRRTSQTPMPASATGRASMISVR